MLHTRKHTPTDKLNNGTLYAPRYEEAFLHKAKNGLIMKRLCPKGKKRPHYKHLVGLVGGA